MSKMENVKRVSGCPPDLSGGNRKITSSQSDSARGSKESGSTASTFAILTAGAVGMAFLLALVPAAGHDQMWVLYAARLMLHGTRLYGPQLFESNPPLIFWMSMVPVGMGEALHLPVTAIGKLLVAGLELAVAAIALKLLRTLVPDLPRNRVWSLAFVFVTVFALMPARDFGQRDHLLALLILPYILAAALDLESAPAVALLEGWKRVAIGVAAGLGVSLKPHHLLVAVAIEVVLLLRRPFRRVLRVEAVALVATCIAYLAAIRLLTPAYLSAVVPILRDTYWAIGSLTLTQLVGQAVQLHIVAALALLLYFAMGWRKAPPLITLLLVAGAASTVAYYLQGTGWYYQQLPGLSFFALALWLELVDFAERHPVRMAGWAPGMAAVLSLFSLGLTAYFSGVSLGDPLHFPSGVSDVPDPSFFRSIGPGTPIAILTTEVDDSVPAFFTRDLVWAQRENNLWTLPAILRNESPTSPGDPPHRIPPERLTQLDNMQHRWMVEDIEYWRPALILIQRCQDRAVHCQIIEDRHDDLLAWFLRDRRFQQVFSRYHYVRSAGPFDAYVPNSP